MRYTCELHLSPRNPSYITRSRHGIWYFQLWITEFDEYGLDSRRKLFRKSLRTRSRRKALKLARRWWIKMADDSKERTTLEIIEEMEQAIAREPHLYNLGAKIVEKIETWGIDENDSFQMDSFFESLTPPQQEAYIFYLESRQKAREKADKQTAQTSTTATHHPSSKTSQKVPRPRYDEQDPSIEQMLHEWLKTLSDLKPSTTEEYERMGQLFVRILRESNEKVSPSVSEVSPQMIREYQAIIERIPKYTKTCDLTVAQIKKLNGPPRSQGTIRNTYRNMALFLKWVDGRGYPLDPLALKAMTPSARTKITDKKDREFFDDGELKQLFESERYRHGKFKRACDYWAPLIALFTGARLGEIAQLYVDDIYKAEEGWIFDLNEQDDKSLKTKSSARLVPIHKKLVELGLLEFREHQKAQGHKKMFPDEKRSPAGKFALYSKRFGTFRKSVGASPRHDKEFRDFHSFRYLVRTRLVEANVEEVIIDQIFGHLTPGQSIGATVYTKSDRLPAKFKAIRKLKYDIDFDKIRNWKHHRFHKDVEARKREARRQSRS